MRSRLLPASLLAAASLAACSAAPPPPEPLPPRPPRAPDWSVPAPAPPAPPPAAARTLEVTLGPQRDPTGEVTSLDVALRFSEPPGEFGDASPLVLVLNESHEGETGWPEAVEDVYARDGEGALALKQKAVKVDGEDAVEWRSDRHPVGAINITYRVRVPKPDGARFSGLRSHAGGFQGTGSTFLLLPETPDTYVTRVRWSLGALGEGTIATSSFGAGDVEATGPLERLQDAVFMAGALGRMELDQGTTHFRAAWLGRPAFDPGEAVAWAARIRGAERDFFQDPDPSPFTLFLRAVPHIGAAWVGTGRTGGFLLLAGDELGWTRKTRFVVAHELIHHWIGKRGTGVRFEGPEGSAYWFSEGFTVHYTRELMLRSGACTPEEFEGDLRERTERFVTSSVKTAPNDEIVQKFWSGREHQQLPYDRGMLYAAEVDAAVRAKSGGKRSLDDLVLGLLARGRALGKAAAESARGDGPKPDGPPAVAPLPASAWRDLVGSELGPEAQARFDAVILRGELPAPPSDAFGPCFKSVKKKLPRFELGFEPASITEHKLRGLVRGSAADRAGLREGDVIHGSVTLGDTGTAVEITVERAGKTSKLSFLPHGASVEGTIWVRDPRVPAASCARGVGG